MKIYWFLACFFVLRAQAQVTEPDTVFYGRVVNPNSPAPFILQAYEGALSWTIRNSLTGQSQTFKAKLQPLAGGGYSYRLNVPHHALGYTLPASSKSLPLTGSGVRFEHQSITINGASARIAAPAVTFTTAQQATRAATYRVDLELLDLVADSDGDGIPDWWEEKNGLDKWDDSDAAAVFARLNPANNNALGDESHISTFAQWRSFHFPGSVGSLEEFAEQDHDQDSIPNLIEYAFGLNPRSPNDAPEKLPSSGLKDGQMLFSFQKRTAATDLLYSIETSEDLLSWTAGDNELAAIPAAVSTLAVTTVSFRRKDVDQNHFFLRVKVGLK